MGLTKTPKDARCLMCNGLMSNHDIQSLRRCKRRSSDMVAESLRMLQEDAERRLLEMELSK